MKLALISSCEKHTDKGLRQAHSGPLVLVQSHLLPISPQSIYKEEIRAAQLFKLLTNLRFFSISKEIASTLEQKTGKERRKRMGEQGMNSKKGMDIKGNRRRVQRIECNRKRTKEEIRERGERKKQKKLGGPGCFECDGVLV